MKNKYLFVFENKEFAIVETKLLDMPEGTPPDKVYFWLKIDKINDQCERFEFVSMKKEPIQVREFKEGTLQFDSNNATFNGIELDVLEIKDISDYLNSTIVEFLNN